MASQTTNPKSMATIRLFSGAILFSVAAFCIHPTLAKRSDVEECVKLRFDPPADEPPSQLKKILCSDTLKAIGISIRATGVIPPEYLNALKKVPKYRKHPKALRKFLCALSGSKSWCERDPPAKRSNVEECVKLTFDPPAEESPSKLKKIVCRDTLRAIGISIRATGVIPPEYLHALKKVPKFKKHPKDLEKLLCDLTYNEKPGCRRDPHRWDSLENSYTLPVSRV